jgi:hypothetical protein
VGGVRFTTPFPNCFEAARALLRRNDVAQATCVVSVTDMAAWGSPLDRWETVLVSDAAAVRAQERELFRQAVSVARAQERKWPQ